MLKMGVFLLALLWAAPAKATETPWVSTDYVQAKLISASDSIASDAPIAAAIEIQLADGWHAYWRMPGDAGLAPVFDWSSSENIGAIEVSWPAPQRFSEQGLNSFGYKDRVAFPLLVKTGKSQVPVLLNLKVSIMVCNEICVPQDVSVSLSIPVADSATAPQGRRHAAIVEKMKDSLPHKGDLPSLRIDSAVIGPDALVVRAWSKQGFDDADLFVESGDIYLTAVPEVTPDKDDSRAAFLRIAKPEGVDNLATALAGRTLTLTMTGGGQAIEREYSF